MEHTEPSESTQEAENREAEHAHVSDRLPSADEERAADASRERFADDAEEVAEHEHSMAERGANVEGEGHIP